MKLDNKLLKEMIAEALEEIKVDPRGHRDAYEQAKKSTTTVQNQDEKDKKRRKANQADDSELPDWMVKEGIMDPQEKINLESSLEFLKNSLEHIKELIGKALDIEDPVKKKDFLSVLQNKAADVLDMIDTVKNTMENPEKLEEEVVSPEDINNAEKKVNDDRKNLAQSKLTLAQLQATDAAEATTTTTESFQLTKGRLRQIISEELISAKKQGLL